MLGVTHYHGIKMTQMSAPPVQPKKAVARASYISHADCEFPAYTHPGPTDDFGCDGFNYGGPVASAWACCDHTAFRLGTASNWTYLNVANAQQYIAGVFGDWAFNYMNSGVFYPGLNVHVAILDSAVDYYVRYNDESVRTMSYFIDPYSHNYVWVLASEYGPNASRALLGDGSVQWGYATHLTYPGGGWG